MQQTHCGMHASIFSHIWTTRGAGSLVYVRVESGRFLAGEDICGATDHFQRFWNGCGRKRDKQLLRRSCWITLLRPLGIIRPKTSHPGHSPDFSTSPTWLSWHCMQQTHCGMHASIFSHTWTTRGAGSLVLCPSQKQSVPGRRVTYVGLPITSSGIETAADVIGLIPNWDNFNVSQKHGNFNGYYNFIFAICVIHFVL